MTFAAICARRSTWRLINIGRNGVLPGPPNGGATGGIAKHLSERGRTPLHPKAAKPQQKLLNCADVTLTAKFHTELQNEDFLDSMEMAYEKQQARQKDSSIDAIGAHKSPPKGALHKEPSNRLILDETP